MERSPAQVCKDVALTFIRVKNCNNIPMEIRHDAASYIDDLFFLARRENFENLQDVHLALSYAKDILVDLSQPSACVPEYVEVYTKEALSQVEDLMKLWKDKVFCARDDLEERKAVAEVHVDKEKEEQEVSAGRGSRGTRCNRALELIDKAKEKLILAQKLCKESLNLVDESADSVLMFFGWEELDTFQAIDKNVSAAIQFASESCDKLNLMKIMTGGLRYREKILKKTHPRVSFDFMLDVVDSA